MARLAVNGAVVSDDGEWFSTGFRWKPLVASPTGKPPAYRSVEGKQLMSLGNQQRKAYGWAGRSLGQAGEELARLVVEHGNVEAAERAIVETEERARAAAAAAEAEAAEAEAEVARMANYGRRSDDGLWWWDGQQWRPT